MKKQLRLLWRWMKALTWARRELSRSLPDAEARAFELAVTVLCRAAERVNRDFLHSFDEHGGPPLAVECAATLSSYLDDKIDQETLMSQLDARKVAAFVLFASEHDGSSILEAALEEWARSFENLEIGRTELGWDT